jgi:hypothetical protein
MTELKMNPIAHTELDEPLSHDGRQPVIGGKDVLLATTVAARRA